jgi:hypothetical protein
MRAEIFKSKVLVTLSLVFFLFFITYDIFSEESSFQESEVKELLREGLL